MRGQNHGTALADRRHGKKAFHRPFSFTAVPQRDQWAMERTGKMMALKRAVTWRNKSAWLPVK